MKFNGMNDNTASQNFFVFQLTINPQPLDIRQSNDPQNDDENKPGTKVFFLLLGRELGTPNQYKI